MASRAELDIRANVLGLDQTLYPNDSKLEQKVLYLEKNATAFTGTIGTTTLTSNGTNASNNDNITIGGVTYTFVTTKTEAAATSTLTNSVSFADGDIVAVGRVAYIMRTALSTSLQTLNEVLIGANVAASLTNLKTTINGTGQGSTTNTNTVANPDVSATSTSTTLVVTALVLGTAANSLVTAGTSANASWTGAFLAGGANPVVDQIIIQSSAANTLASLKAALNGTGTAGTDYSTGTAANPVVIGTTLTSTTLVINSRDYAVTNASIGTTVGTGATLSFTGATLASGVGKDIVASAAINAQVSGAANVG